MIYCKKCVYPIIAVNLEINDDGICSSCKTFEEFNSLTCDDWKKRKKKFENIIEKIISETKNGNYHCVIPVSGGKDSYFQTHLITKVYGLKPLLVTYHGNNFLPEGDHNRDRMKEVFDVDHVVWSPGVEVLKKLNRIGFEVMGDMNWQNHCGIFTAPIDMAVKFKIPYIFWGEISWDISGMFGANDFVEFSARTRHEHGLRGYEWCDLLKYEETLKETDFNWAKYPDDSEIQKINLRGLYIGNYFKWDANEHTKMVVEKYGWKPRETPFQRTYRNFSNLDDKYENGVHDLMKFIKFGYGRGSDHASKDIRNGHFTREEGIKMVRKYDHVVSDDLYDWLEYVGRDKKYFWNVADKFRDPRVWRIKNNQWYKDNVWGGESAYGDVHLSNEEIAQFQKKQEKK